MKNGYKHKTTLFGTAGENYVSRLLMLLKNPNGDRRPDLVSVDGRYNPILSVELKSGAKRKGILVDYQLHYSITTVQAYIELFGENPPKRVVSTELFPNIPIPEASRLLPGDPIAYYYGILDRVDNLKADDLDRPYSTLKCEWGDLFLVPSDLAFFSFVACRIMRTGEKDVKVISELKDMMKRDALSWNSHDYAQRKGHLCSWQNIHGRDMLALFENDMNIATSKGKKRIDIISTNYEGLKDLKKVRIKGYNNTNIYVLTKPEDFNLFDFQVRETINGRIPILEKVFRGRRRALSLLDTLSVFEMQTPDFFIDNYRTTLKNKRSLIKLKEVERLEGLVKWLDFDEKELSISINPF